jgi:hypothetical protein
LCFRHQLGSDHCLWPGGGTEEKRVGWTKFWVSKSWVNEKQNNSRVGWYKFIVISKARFTEILKTKKRWQQSYVNTICKSIVQSRYQLIIFRFVRKQMVSPKKVYVQTTWNFRLQKIVQAIIKLMSQKCINGHVWQLNDIILARGGYLFFNWYVRLGKKYFGFLMVSNIFTNTFSFPFLFVSLRFSTFLFVSYPSP